AQLLEGALPDLAHPLSGHAQHRADPFEGERLGAFFETVVQRENTLLSGGEIAAEQPGEELSLQTDVHELLDVSPEGAGDSLPVSGRGGIVPLDRGVQADL